MNIESALRERIAKLEEELAEARETICFLEAPAEEFDPWPILERDARMTPKEGAVLRKLYEARGFVHQVDVEEELWSTTCHPDTLNVWICGLRKKLGKDAIETSYGRGYRLTEPGRALIRQRLAAIARDAA